MGIEKILNLLPMFLVDYPEVRLVNKLNNSFNFDHNVLLLDQSSDRTIFINSGNLPRSLYVFNVNSTVEGLETITITINKEQKYIDDRCF